MIMIIKQKYYIMIIVALIGIATAKHFYDRNERNRLISDIKKDLQNEKDIALEKVGTEMEERDNKIKTLIQSNERAKADSKYWYNQAKKKVVNPVYDIDFITAANILANSRYRPDKRNDSIRQRGDN